MSYNSISAEAADWIEIADFKELRRIINSSIRPQTRHVRLTSDITITGADADTYYIISPPAAPIYIDTGEYTIYVEGQLVVMGSVSVFGKGGDGGLIHINKGGHTLPSRLPETQLLWTYQKPPCHWTCSRQLVKTKLNYPMIHPH